MPRFGEGRLNLLPRFGQGVCRDVKSRRRGLCCSATTSNHVKTNLVFGSALFLLPVEGCGLADAYYSGSELGRALEVQVMTGLTRNRRFFSQVTETINA